MRKSLLVVAGFALVGGFAAVQVLGGFNAVFKNLATVFDLSAVTGPTVTVGSTVVKHQVPITFTITNGGNTAVKTWKLKATNCGSGITIASPTGISCNGSEVTLSLSSPASATWVMKVNNTSKDSGDMKLEFRSVDRKNRTISITPITLNVQPPFGPGDADGNGVIDFDDFSLIGTGFNTGGTRWKNGDFNGDRIVNFDDFSIINSAFNTQSGISLKVVSPNGGEKWMLGTTSHVIDQTTKLQGQSFTTYLVGDSQKYQIDQGTFTADGTHDRTISLGLTQVPVGLYYVRILSTTTSNTPIMDQSDGKITVAAPVAPPPTTFIITATAGTNGTISPSGAVSVTSGQSRKFDIIPANGYKIATLKVDNVDVTATSSYTFTNVTANHTIAATFSANPVTTYIITATAGVGGTITPTGQVSVPSGTGKTFDALVSSGYVFKEFIVDGSPAASDGGYSFTNVTANHTIHATFVTAPPPPTSYTIFASAGPNGTISSPGTTTVSSGGSKTYTITPNAGYQIASLIVNGNAVTPATTYTFANVTSNKTIAVTFSLVPPPSGTSLNVRTYGAIPNDGIDDAAAIQAAINTAATTTKKTVLFDAGTYNLKNNITLKPGITLTSSSGLQDALLDSYIPVTSTSFNKAYNASNADGIKVTNLKFRANNGIFSLATANNAEFRNNDFQWGYEGSSYNRYVFWIPSSANGLKIENNYFHDSELSDRNLSIWGWANGSYSYNTFYKINDGGHILDPGHNFIMKGNYGRLIHRMGIEVQQETGFPPAIWPQNFVIEDNVLYDWNKPYWDSMGLSVPLAGINVTIRNNYLKQNAYNGVWGPADSSGTVRGSYGIEAPQAPSGQSGGTVDGNVIISERNVMGIACPGKNTTVKNNKLYGPFAWGAIGGEPGSLGGGDCGPWQTSNNLITPSITNAPPPPPQTL
jgi:hypothetical protein